MIELVLGGARSGKSAYAQQQAKRKSDGRDVLYLATATPTDDEMAARITRHQADRPASWMLLEQPLDLSHAIGANSQHADRLILVDCLTLWLNNEIYHRPEQTFEQLSAQLINALHQAQSDIILVTNEVGLGVIPMGEVTRQFVDWAGWLNQSVAKAADKVTFVTAGLPMVIKEAGE